MWCVECHNLFSWNSGQCIHNEINHNPEFYRYQRAVNNGVAPRVPGDIPLGCEAQITYEAIEDALWVKKQIFPLWPTCHRLIGHIRHIILPRYPLNRFTDNSDLRVAFLLQTIDEKKWITELTKRQKIKEKNRAMNQLLELIVITLNDIFAKFVGDYHDQTNIKLQTDRLREYVNQEFIKIGYRYGNKTWSITDNWTTRLV